MFGRFEQQQLALVHEPDATRENQSFAHVVRDENRSLA